MMAGLGTNIRATTIRLDWETGKSMQKIAQWNRRIDQRAERKKIKFGIWIEPEMVNPKSELYEKHPDWIITSPNRDLDLSRNQLILDLSNPKVQSTSLPPSMTYSSQPGHRLSEMGLQPICDKSRIFIFATRITVAPLDQVHTGLLSVLQRVRANYPDVYLMLCSGGGGRIDYGSMPFFDEYWISDNTDALDRIFIQWGTTHFFPPLVWPVTYLLCQTT